MCRSVWHQPVKYGRLSDQLPVFDQLTDASTMQNTLYLETRALRAGNAIQTLVNVSAISRVWRPVFSMASTHVWLSQAFIWPASGVFVGQCHGPVVIARSDGRSRA
jgi:hypothetical protein